MRSLVRFPPTANEAHFFLFFFLFWQISFSYFVSLVPSRLFSLDSHHHSDFLVVGH